MKGIIKPQEAFYKKCPYCFETLSMINYMKRKSTKLCVCDKCNKTIDERYVKW